MKKVFFLLTLVLTTVYLNAQTKTNTWQNNDGEFIETTKPIVIYEKGTYDFGEIIEGEKYDYIFKFKNVGTEPLILQNVKASCGCTTPEWSKEPIMSGKSGEIKVIYDTKNRMGAFNKAITITSNAIEPTKRLYIKGTVIKGDDEQLEETEDQELDTPKVVLPTAVEEKESDKE